MIDPLLDPIVTPTLILSHKGRGKKERSICLPSQGGGKKENDTGQPRLYPSNVVQAFRPDEFRQTQTLLDNKHLTG